MKNKINKMYRQRLKLPSEIKVDFFVERSNGWFHILIVLLLWLIYFRKFIRHTTSGDLQTARFYYCSYRLTK